MGRRRSLRWDGQLSLWAAFALTGAAFFLGGVLGCVFAGLIDGEAAAEVSGYLLACLRRAALGDAPASFWRVFWEQARFPLVCFFLGFTALGVVGLPLLFAGRGFLLTFSVACLCRLLGHAGLLPAFFLFGLPALLWAPALFVLGTQGFLGSAALLRRALGDSRAVLPYDSGYFTRCGLCAAVVALSVVLEHRIVPPLLGAAARLVLP